MECAATGGRVVLLGSPRGEARQLPLREIRRKRLEVVGAHVDMLPLYSARTGRDEERFEGQRFISLLASGNMTVDDLTGDPVDPREAGLYYRRLAKYEAREAYFDWTRLPMSERMSSGHLLVPPDLRIRGLDFERRPLSLSKNSPALIDSRRDPFSGAKGQLRIGLLGCGDIGIDNAAAAAAAPNVELVCCHDPSERLAEQVAAKYGARVARSTDDLLESQRRRCCAHRRSTSSACTSRNRSCRARKARHCRETDGTYPRRC